MKREILCPPCAETTARAITGSKFIDGQIVDPYPGEHAKFLTGTLTRHCYCDSCNKNLPVGTKAVAVSIWTTRQGAYFLWEFEFFEVSNQTSMSGIASPDYQGKINS